MSRGASHLAAHAMASANTIDQDFRRQHGAQFSSDGAGQPIWLTNVTSKPRNVPWHNNARKQVKSQYNLQFKTQKFDEFNICIANSGEESEAFVWFCNTMFQSCARVVYLPVQ